MNPFKALLIPVILLCCSALAASTLISVQAVDEGKSASRISIRLSDTGDYQFSGSGKDIYVALPGARLGTTEAQYRRLSHVIDYISLSEDAGGSYVTIRLMDDFKISHYKTGSGLTIQVGQALPVKQSPAVQKLANPKAVPRLSPTPADTALTRDSLASGAAPAKPVRKIVPKPKASCPQLWQSFVAVFEAQPVVYAFCLFIILGFLAILLRPKRLPKQAAEKPGPDLGLNGASLIMDSETKIRMITKLLEEGWTPREISQEMKLPQTEIEQIAASSRFGD